MNEQELQQAFLQYIAEKTGAKDEKQLEEIIQNLGEEGLKEAYADFMKEIQQAQVQAAKFGAKLNYIKKLNGICPEGQELRYFKIGGKLCKKCMAKQLKNGSKVKENPIEEFKRSRRRK